MSVQFQFIPFEALSPEMKLHIYTDLPNINSKYLLMCKYPEMRFIIPLEEIKRVLEEMGCENYTRHADLENKDPECQASQKWSDLLDEIQHLSAVPFIPDCKCGGLIGKQLRSIRNA